jgi:hypothetical protein
MKSILTMIFVVGVLGCSSKNCRETRQEEAAVNGGVSVPAPIAKEKDPMSKTALADRIRVYKPDGSLQCGMGDKISLSDMQKQLGAIKVHKSYNKHDGMMRTQVCGSPTGNNNVYEIDRKDLAAAQKAGFKEWTFE